MFVHKRRLLLIFALVLVVQGLAACNTISGAGQDIGAAGEAIEKKAEQKKKY
ncbi:MAG: entericidin A/B family lipoprotein [Candidatus Competibacteraceae bacterium]|nr:entericidin A/B family lipoprotein [Candidatus Competibacteraceae bacterium]